MIVETDTATWILLSTKHSQFQLGEGGGIRI